MVALGINNGWIDPKPQFKTYATFAYNNPYKKILVNANYKTYLDAYEKYCLPAINKCNSLEGNNEACARADEVCNVQMYVNLSIGSKVDFNVYDVRIGRKDVDPPDTYLHYITRQDVARRIGAKTRFHECDESVYSMMSKTGDCEYSESVPPGSGH